MLKHFFWDMIGKMGAQVVTLILAVVLTRLLSPSEFGIVGIAMSVIFIASIIVDMGFGRALVQSNNIGGIEYSSVFYLNLVIGLILTIICFLIAGPLAGFYHQPQVAPVLKALSGLFFLNSLSLVPAAILYKDMKFKLISVTGLLSTLISGIIGVFMAFKGMGVWSLVVQNLIAAGITVLLNFYNANWLPLIVIDKVKLKPLWEYGSRMFSSAMINSIVSRLDVFIIGKLFATSTVGFYTRAQSFDGVARQLTAGSLSSVLFPAVSKIQHDRKALMRLYKRYLHLISLAGMALSGYLYLVTPDLFRGLFTEKWDNAALYFQIMCISGFIWPISAIMINIIAGVGNSKAYLQVEYIKTILLIPAYLIVVFKGIVWFLWVMVAVRCLTVYFNAWFISKEINFTIRKQLSIIAGYLICNILVVWITHLMVGQLIVGHHFIRVLLFSVIYLLLLAGLHKTFRTGAFYELNNLKLKIQSKFGY